jgi:hypothetical protein
VKSLRTIILHTAAVSLLVSCGKRTQTIHIRFENGAGLDQCDSLFLQNKVVGYKTGLKIDPRSYIPLLTVEVDDRINIPVDSRFEVEHRSPFENTLVLHPGKSTSFLSENDTVTGYLPENIPAGEILLKVLDDIEGAVRGEKTIQVK